MHTARYGRERAQVSFANLGHPNSLNEDEEPLTEIGAETYDQSLRSTDGCDSIGEFRDERLAGGTNGQPQIRQAHSPAPLDPRIQAAIQQISAERIQQDIAKLVSFHNRSTLSSNDKDLPPGQGCWRRRTGLKRSSAPILRRAAGAWR